MQPTSENFGVALLDTNILDYAFKPHTKVSTSTLIQRVAKKYTLVISEYLRFEVYRGLDTDRIPAAKAIVGEFSAYAVDKATLDVAAAITTCYEKDPVTSTKRSGFSDGDLILAATAFVHKFIIITANRMDFPAPYFEEIAPHEMTTTKGRTIIVYELKPNIKYLNEMLETCYPTSST